MQRMKICTILLPRKEGDKTKESLAIVKTSVLSGDTAQCRDISCFAIYTNIWHYLHEH